MKKQPHRGGKWFLLATSGILLVAVLTLWIAWGNTALVVTELTVTSTRLPQGFDGFCIVQISDLHNEEFGEENSRLVEMLAETAPNCIILTGDLVDSRRTDVEIALSFGRQAAALAPTYYVTGNHEARIGQLEKLKAGLEEAGVTVLENESVTFTQGGETITLAGVEDFGLCGGTEQAFRQTLEGLLPGKDPYTVLLSHRPEYFSLYCQLGFDLVLAGHAHGGQFRLPGVGGLWAPGQGLFPTYDAGLYQEGSTAMVVSRGLGNSLFPFRLNNRPEIVVVTLRAGE